MYPVLQIGPLALQTYPLALLLAVWAGLATGARAAARLGIDGDHVYNAVLSGLAAGLVVARLGHVIAFWPAYRLQPLDIVSVNTRAFLPWPGLLAGLCVAAWYVYRHGLPWSGVLDAVAPGALVGAGIADVGAFLTGQAPGAPSDLPWAIAIWGVRRHPVQLYEVLAALFVLVYVLWALRRGLRPGTAAWLAAFGYGLSRWLLEPFHADSAVILGGLRTAQVLGLVVALVALSALRTRLTPGQTPEEPGEPAVAVGGPGDAGA